MKFADLLTMRPDQNMTVRADEFGVRLSFSTEIGTVPEIKTTFLQRLTMVATVDVWSSPEEVEAARENATRQLLAGIYGDTLKELAVLRSAIYAGNRGEAYNAAQRIEDHILGRNL